MGSKLKRSTGQKSGVNKGGVAAATTVAYCLAHQYPVPVGEHEFHPARAWRFDLAFVAEKVAVEFEGGVWTGGRHTRGTGYSADIEKYNAASLMGWRVIRCTYKQLQQGLLWKWLDMAFTNRKEVSHGGG